MAIKRDRLVQAVAGMIARRGLIAPGDHVLAAVSGGADSVALAAILAELSGGRRGGFRLTLAHLDHGLRETSRRDAESVARLAARLGVELVSLRRDVARLARQRKLGIEEAARLARYQFLERAARQVGATRVALGHHQDDQAETVLLNLLRGGDVRGLAGMPVRRPISPSSAIEVVRPLLEVPREQLRAFLHRRGLGWVEDETNQSMAPLRNRIRLELLPLLERDYVAGISRRLATLAGRMSTLAEQLQAEADRVWPAAVRQRESCCLTLERSVLLAAGPSVTARLFCRAIEELQSGLAAVTAEHLDGAWDLVAAPRGGRQMALPGGISIHREGRSIIVEKR